jgi:hypothetical protein
VEDKIEALKVGIQLMLNGEKLPSLLMVSLGCRFQVALVVDIVISSLDGDSLCHAMR